MIKSTNVGVLNRIARDPKKDTVEIEKSFVPIGFIDDDEKRSSMADQTRNMSMESARLKIQELRRSKASLLGTLQQQQQE